MSTSHVTQIVYLDVDPDEYLNPAGHLASNSDELESTWYRLLNLSERSDGFIEQYWSRGWEDPIQIRLHIVRETLQHHLDFGDSSSGKQFESLCQRLCLPRCAPKTRFVELNEFVTANGRARDAPITGTGIWHSTDEIWNCLVWPLWTHIVRYAPGCRGVTGGRVIDRQGQEEGYLVYVGWDTYDAHQDFRRSEEYQGKRAVLKMGNTGRAEYHHVIFHDDLKIGRH